MSDTTNIQDLPSDPTGSGVNNNINVVTTETVQPLDQTTINQIVTGLQQASVNGTTALPSRDIPRNTAQIVQDPYTQPNYIPPPNNQNMDYIDEEGSNEEIIHKYQYMKNSDDSLDSLYSEIQTPLLLAVVYFIFQIPIFKVTLFKHLPFLFNKDANFNINGLLFTSALYGLIYYACSKLLIQFSKF